MKERIGRKDRREGWRERERERKREERKKDKERKKEKEARTEVKEEDEGQEGEKKMQERCDTPSGKCEPPRGPPASLIL